MQRSDPKDARKSEETNGGQQQVSAATVQHYVLASQIQALTSQGIISGLHGTNSASLQVLGGTSPSIQQQQPPTVVVISTSATSQTSTILPAPAQHALQQELVGQGLVGIVTQDGQPLTISGVSSQLTGRVGELQIGQPLTTGGSGRTIHHHGQSPLRGSVATPHTNLQQQSLLNMNNNQILQQKTATTTAVTSSGTSVNSPAVAAAGRVLLEAKPSMSSVGRRLTFPNLTAFANQSTTAGPSPKKKIKIEENVPASSEIAQNRKLILDHKHKEMSELKENYIECLTELFFLQNGGNMMDYFLWKKRPTPQLVHFLKSGNLDSDEDEEQGLERKINNEVKVITCSGSNVPLATPVAISTTLPPSVAALNQQGCEVRRLGGRHGMVFGHIQPTIATQINPVVTTAVIVAAVQPPLPHPTSIPSAPLSGTIPSNQQKSVSLTTSVDSLSTPIVSQKTSASSATTTTVTMTTSTSMSQLQSHLAKAITDTKPLSVHTSSHHKSGITTPSSNQLSAGARTPKSPPVSPSRLHTRQHNISAVYDGTIGSQEAIVERAKQEAQCMQRVAELRKDGLWSTRRLPKVQEPPRNKTHWDYLLEEMQWLASDFAQERKWKKAAARKLSRMVTKHFQELEQKEVRAEKEEAQKLKKIAGQIARQIREFWNNIEKVVQFKQTTRLEEKRKKALDIHLNFIVDQTEKYSTWLTEGLKKERTGSSVGSLTPEHSIDGGDNEFKPDDEDTDDDEETIAKEEAEAEHDDVATKDELAALQKESELPIEELLQSLPQEVLDKPASVKSDGSDQEANEKDDEEFNAEEEEEVDVEETIEEQEKQEKADYNEELKDLQDEGDMSMEELYKKYAAAYDSDFEMPEESASESESDDDDDEEEEDDEDEDEEEEEDSDEDVDVEDIDGDEDVGLEFLMHPEKDQVMQEDTSDTKSQGDFEDKGPGKELTDIAAEAQSLQPKGYTLQTTEVKTAVPFLLKHKLREYQHVGLDWLATMYEKKLNGILADEMGLGKTIQTIALLAHLACEKSIWGPHLIVVPTSVMLNWEMEIKKWCPAFKILTYYGSQKERKLKRQGWTKTNAFHVCITSYKLVIQDHQSFRRKKWKYLILDEAQNIKNFKSQRWQTLLNFSSQRRLLLTGTPLQNSLMELWSLMHFLMPHVFQSHREFKEWFANPLTGMIEGSHEYNESLIRRLHKVLRPFLLRRLKDDVEKQMPKKYEHVIMCPLSKRQRFLYDEFMSQTKTKETLATGHFMSVINILMQLRKVCNHPSLFDPRPITSPFRTEAIVYRTASLALKAFEYDPFKNIDIRSIFPSLADMELDLPAFIAHRVKKLQPNKKLIEEIDDQSEYEEERLKPGKLKSTVFRSISPMITSGRSSPVDQSAQLKSPSQVNSSAQSLNKPENIVASSLGQTNKDSTTVVTAIPVATLAPVQTIISSVTTAAATSSIQTVQATLQAKVLPQSAGQSVVQTSSSQITTSQPITVQIQQTEQGARLMIPAGQLSQLPAGFIQIVQTSMGQQIIATSSPVTTAAQQTAAQTITTTSVSVVNGPPTITTMASSSVNTVVTSVTTQTRTTPTIQLPSTSAVSAGSKPVMKVSPIATESATNMSPLMSTTSPQDSKPITSTTMSVPSVRMSIGQSHTMTRSNAKKDLEKNLKKSELYLSSLWEKRKERLKERLDYISRLNKIHCDRKPVYGEDLCHSVNIYRTMYETSSIPWTGEGYINCHNAHLCKSPYRPEHFWNRTKVLSDIVHTPEQYLQELYDILSRYTFVTPPVTAPPISMHVSHPPPQYLTEDRWREFMLHTELSPRTSSLHMISTNMLVQFPELRLIQYDCGKLQTLDILLRRLKSGQHRVLIFTQMTRMLDILESFLNFHGHRYLRLDGATRIEQRQLLMDRFNADPRIFCFILSTRSGGLGVNLTGADTVVFYDSDWNPTMDAQAQDRCHRIGQTRDVHIYRLISEQTVEENILKKANQKRMLGDMAIEGGNFTTAFFKEQTIKELFNEPSGLDSLVKEKTEAEMESKPIEKGSGDDASVVKQAFPKVQSETNIMAQFEKALGKAEDETDVTAADQAKAEQKAELAEFDENIPWDEREAERKKEEDDVSRAEQELAMLDKELSPVERYAVAFMELELEPLAEELEMAEEDVENAKKDWELGRLKALKEEEERRAEIEEDEMLFTFSREDAYNKVFKSDIDQENMPMWAPPTPPHDDNDIYIDQTCFFLYEPHVMPESQLPPIYVKKERKKPKIEAITTRKQKQRKEEQPRVPRSLFDRPTSALLKMRREAKLKHGLLKPFRPVPQVVNKPAIDPAQDQPEWLIHEDWALLQAVQSLFDVPLNLMVISPAHQPNWDLVADVVNCCSRVYRSAKQCKYRYENVVIPREEGRILYDMNPKKQSKKTKGIYKTKNNRPMRTSQLFVQDGNNAVTMLHSLRFDSSKSIAGKRPPTLKQTLVNPTLKNPKHATVLSENGINYDTPLHPMQVAEIRAQRIQREKKQNQAAAQANAEQQLATQRLQQQAQQQTQQPQVQIQQAVQPTTPQPQAQQTTVSAATVAAVAQGVAQVSQPQLQPIVTSTTVLPVATIAKTAVGQTVTALSLSRATTVGGNIVLNAQGGVATNFAAINRRMSQQATANIAQPATVTVTGTLNPAVRAAQRTVTGTPLTIQEITAIGTQAPGQVAHITTGQVARTQIQTSVATTFTGQLAVTQRIATPTTVTAGTVQQQITQPTATKTLTPQQLLTLQQQQLLKQRALQQQQQQQQQFRMQKLNLTADQIRQQQIKQIQGRAVAGQKVITQQLVSSIAGIVPKQTQVKAAATLPRALTQEELNRLKQQQQLAQKTQIPTTQIIQAQVQQLAQPASIATSGTTLVKTVSAPGGGVPIPVSTVNINVSVPQQKTGVVKQPTVSQLHQIQRMQILNKQPRLQTPQKITAIGQQVGKTQSIPLNTLQIIQQQPGQSGQLVQLQQIMKQQKQQGNFIMTQPIIATVTQSQTPAQMVTKVLPTSAATSQVQTITPTATAVTLPPATAVLSPAQPVATISVAPATVPVTKVTAVATLTHEPVTTVQVQPVTTATTQTRIATLSQSVSQPTIQQIQVTPAIQQTTCTPLQTVSSVVTMATPSSTPVAVVQQQVTPAQTVVQAGTVTTQEALAAAQALPQSPQPPQVTIGNVTTVIQTQQQPSSKPASTHYAMRTRNQPKH